MVAVTVYTPGVSATNAPAASIWATPAPPVAATAHSAGTPAMGRPAGSRAVTVNRATSPVRRALAAGSIASRATVFATTWTARGVDAGPALAVIVARPGASACSRPSAVTLATRGLLDAKLTRSARRSPCFEKAVPRSVSRVQIGRAHV